VAGVSVRHLPLRRDMRGSLVASEFGEDVPFAPQRSFLVFDVPGSEIRGEHAHRVCHQFLLCVRGACSVIVDDGSVRETVRLDHPTIGIHIPPMVWGAQFKHSADAVLLVLASHAYDPDDYIRDYQEFLDLRADSGR
jgi:dTDP-4-dehydrorhamnose 3,5-epimerase-like enzyme